MSEFVSKRALVQNLSQENEFDFHENEPVGRTNFHTVGFARRLVLTETQKWPNQSSYEFLLFFFLLALSLIKLRILFAGSPSFVSIGVERI